MKSRLTLLLAMLAVLPLFHSCQLFDMLYLSLENTCWYREEGGQRAIVYFGPQGQASVVQRDYTKDAMQGSYGTFSVDGHRVYVNTSDGSSIQLTRTFSNLKNSKNKNFYRLQRQHLQSVQSGIWTTAENRDLSVCFFKDASNVVFSEYSAKNVEAGIPDGLSTETLPYSLAGSELSFGDHTAALFPEALLLQHRLYLRFPLPEGSGESDVAGTMWLNRVQSGAPVILIFNNGYSFTRIAVAGTGLVQVVRGTYVQAGQTLTMSLDKTTEVCTITNDRFTFMERTFVLVP